MTEPHNTIGGIRTQLGWATDATKEASHIVAGLTSEPRTLSTHAREELDDIQTLLTLTQRRLERLTKGI